MLEKAKLINELNCAYKHFLSTKDVSKFIIFINKYDFKITLFDNFYYEFKLLNDKYEIFFSLFEEYIEINDYDKLNNNIIFYNSLFLTNINKIKIENTMYQLLFDKIDLLTK